MRIQQERICYSMRHRFKTVYTESIYFLFPTLDTPYFESSDKPKVNNIHSSSVTVRWPKAKNISSMETHYYYIVWLQAEGKTYLKSSKQPQTSNTDRFESHIAGLQFNTHYSVKVEPYRQQNELREAGTSTGVTRFKTTCTGKWILCECIFLANKFALR